MHIRKKSWKAGLFGRVSAERSSLHVTSHTAKAGGCGGTGECQRSGDTKLVILSQFAILDDSLVTCRRKWEGVAPNARCFSASWMGWAHIGNGGDGRSSTSD
jgi:hypothetical protein